MNYSKALDTVWAEKKGQIPEDADQLGFIVLGCSITRSTGETERFAQTVVTNGEETDISARLYRNGWRVSPILQLETKMRWDDFSEELAEYIA
jgi:hypothetical protein